jgi:hypothetical protein
VNKELLNIQEMGMVVATEAYNPTILTPDFLKFGGIVPVEWELERQPIQSNAVSQVAYKNGVVIVAQPNRLIFSQPILPEQPPLIEAITQAYIKLQPQVSYQAVGLNFSGYVFADQLGFTAQDYLLKTLMAPGSWQKVGQTAPQATIRLSYGLETAVLSLEIGEVVVRSPEQAERSAILFTANFHRDLNQIRPEARLQAIAAVVNNWKADLQQYQEIVTTRFIESPASSSVKSVQTQPVSAAVAIQRGAK